MAQGPQRQSDVLFRHVGDQIVAINPRTQQVHALEPLAARIFEACDGSLDVKDLAERLETPISTVSEIIDGLADTGIMLGAERRFSRRRAIAGGAGLGAGVVASIVLPAPAMAASGPLSHPPQPDLGQGNQAPDTTITEPRSDAQPQESGAPEAGSAPTFSTATAGSGTGKGLAFTGVDVAEAVAVAAGAIGTGAAMVAGARKHSET
jgi:hypothetical protein